MDNVGVTPRIQFDRAEYHHWFDLLWRPVLIAAATVAALGVIIVAASHAAWSLLGVGRGLVPEDLYALSGFFLVVGLAFSLAIGWAIGSAVAFYVMTLLGFGATWPAARIAMGVVYLALGPLLLLAYHIFYGGWLLGMPRTDLGEWLAESHPSARWLLIYAHPVVDLSLIPLAAIFFGILWKYSERVQRETNLQTMLALTVLGTSFAVALSLAIHSTLVHARIGL